MKRKLIVILVLSVTLLGCLNNTHPNNTHIASSNNTSVANILPNKIMGMEKFVALKGKLALEFVKKSHIGPIKYVKDIALVHYIGNNSMMIVWITEYPSAKIAENQTLLMVKGMRKYGNVWSLVNRTSLDNLRAYYIPEKNHYFFCIGKYMIYLIPINMSKMQIDKFTEVIVRSIENH